MDTATPSQATADARGKGYKDLLSYIVSNTISGEIMAVENYSEMVPLMPDYKSAMEANQQAWEECRHIKQLSKLAERLGFTVEERIVEPQWQKIREHFSRAVKKKNLTACLIIQDIMTETMAILLYRTLSKESDTDPVTAQLTGRILQDELEHLEIGVQRLRKLRAEDPQEVDDALVWAHHRVMPELFSMISTSCHVLCDVLKIECGSLDIGELGLDLDALRVNGLQQYIEILDRVGFDPATTNPLIASMTAYEGMKDVMVGGCGDGTAGKCC
jgi:fatty aldehyde decarbonylase